MAPGGNLFKVESRRFETLQTQNDVKKYFTLNEEVYFFPSFACLYEGEIGRAVKIKNKVIK